MSKTIDNTIVRKLLINITYPKATYPISRYWNKTSNGNLKTNSLITLMNKEILVYLKPIKRPVITAIDEEVNVENFSQK